jgi:hypothetical protein
MCGELAFTYFSVKGNSSEFAIKGSLFATGFCIPLLTAWFFTLYYLRALRMYTSTPDPVAPNYTGTSEGERGLL